MYEDIEDYEAYLKRLLIGMGLDDFCFVPIRFLLNFSDTTEMDRPSIQLSFGDYWWFGEKEKWESFIKMQGEGIDVEVPLLAGELTKLNSDSKNVIFDLKLRKNSVSIYFNNGSVIHSEYPKEDCDVFFINLSTYNHRKVSSGTLFSGLGNGDVFIQKGYFLENPKNRDFKLDRGSRDRK